MDKIKIGIIGTGVGIRTHLKGFRNFPDAEIFAIAGSSEERSKYFAKEYNIPVACADYKELCDIDDLDLVCITTPNNFHKDMLLYAVSKNKNIICEKPMVNTKEEAEEIERIVKDYNKILIIDHQLRFNPYIIEIKKLINDGTLGKIYNVRLNQQGTGFANPSANWLWSFSDKDELTFTLQDKLKLYLRSSIGEAKVITPEGVYQDELENKVSIFSSSFRYLAPKIIKAIKENNNEYINIAATPKDSIYSLKVLDAIKESANKGTSINFTKEENIYF